MGRLSALRKEELLRDARERRLAEPLPPDWTEWDTCYALRSAQHLEKLARRTRDSDNAAELLLAAAEARVIAAQGAARRNPRTTYDGDSDFL
jgi:hypothetical protein